MKREVPSSEAQTSESESGTAVAMRILLLLVALPALLLVCIKWLIGA